MTVAAIVPAYNEAPRIGAVLAVLTTCPEIDEVIVVDDASEDDTIDIAEHYNVHTVKLEHNQGKGGAVSEGVGITSADVLLFIDADLIGLKNRHVRSLIDNMKNDPDLCMITARFTKGRLSTNLSQKIAPILNSQRAIRRSFLERVPDYHDSRFGLETIITNYARQTKAKVKEIEFDGVSQVMKEEKLGPIKGIKDRIKMFRDIAKHRYTKHS